jgi:hypothetical protein
MALGETSYYIHIHTHICTACGLIRSYYMLALLEELLVVQPPSQSVLLAFLR